MKIFVLWCALLLGLTESKSELENTFPWSIEGETKGESVNCPADHVVPDPCRDLNLDAAFTVLGEIFLFDGDYYWRRHAHGASGPHLIRSTWPCAPTDIDAAVTAKHNGRTYFFKGTQVWRFHGFRMDSGYPKNIVDEFPGIPSDLLAVTTWSGNQKLYFFKDFDYWFYDPIKNQTQAAIPISKEWKNFPEHTEVHAAVQHPVTGRTVLFTKEGNFYQYDDVQEKVLDTDRIYNRKTSTVWFGCMEYF